MFSLFKKIWDLPEETSPEEVREREELGITTELITFVENISKYPESWKDFPPQNIDGDPNITSQVFQDTKAPLSPMDELDMQLEKIQSNSKHTFDQGIDDDEDNYFSFNTYIPASALLQQQPAGVDGDDATVPSGGKSTSPLVVPAEDIDLVQLKKEYTQSMKNKSETLKSIEEQLNPSSPVMNNTSVNKQPLSPPNNAFLDDFISSIIK
eukprot:gene7472-8743_t